MPCGDHAPGLRTVPQPWVLVFPPRPYDWKRAYGDLAAHEGNSGQNAFPSDALIRSTARHCQVLVVHSWSWSGGDREPWMIPRYAFKDDANRARFNHLRDVPSLTPAATLSIAAKRVGVAWSGTNSCAGRSRLPHHEDRGQSGDAMILQVTGLARNARNGGRGDQHSCSVNVPVWSSCETTRFAFRVVPVSPACSRRRTMASAVAAVHRGLPKSVQVSRARQAGHGTGGIRLPKRVGECRRGCRHTNFPGWSGAWTARGRRAWLVGRRTERR